MQQFLKLSVLLVSLFLNQVYAQTEQQFLQLVDTLSSKAFIGRGASGGGDTTAAIFLETQFLQENDSVYRQAFSYKLNTFEGEIQVSINDKDLVLGEDYLPYPATPSVQKEFLIVDLRDDDVLEYKASDKKAYLVQESQLKMVYKWKRKPGAVLVQRKGGLFHSLAQYQFPFPVVWISKDFSFSGRKNKISLEIDADLKTVTSENVISYIKGKNSDSLLVVCAHYDHLGLVGKEQFIPGANDNASGTAFLLLLHQYFSVNKPNKDIVFIAFAAEEVGLLGSYHYVEQLDSLQQSKIAQVVNFDLMGAGSEGITVTNGKSQPSFVHQLEEVNDTLQLEIPIKIRAQSQNSDHYPFSLQNVPAVFIYSNGEVGGYHNFDDVVADLEQGQFTRLFELFKTFLKER